MQTLYVLSVLSFLALVWAAFSITRHIRRSAATQSPIDPPIVIRPARTKSNPASSSPEARKEPIPFRDPVSTRDQADWLALQKAIGSHDLGNLDYPRAAGGASTRPTRSK